MLVDRPGNVGLVRNAQQVLQRNRQQPRSGSGKERQDREKIIALDGVVTQYVGQHPPRMVPGIVALARIEAERAFQVQIAGAAPTGKRRKVMGIERHQRVRRIVVAGAKIAVMIPLEHHHAIRPDPPFRDLFAKTLGHRAKVLSDHHAILSHALQRGDGQQRLKRHPHIRTVSRAKAVRHQIEPLEAEDMIQPDRARVAHRRA